MFFYFLLVWKMIPNIIPKYLSKGTQQVMTTVAVWNSLNVFRLWSKGTKMNMMTTMGIHSHWVSHAYKRSFRLILSWIKTSYWDWKLSLNLKLYNHPLYGSILKKNFVVISDLIIIFKVFLGTWSGSLQNTSILNFLVLDQSVLVRGSLIQMLNKCYNL